MKKLIVLVCIGLALLCTRTDYSVSRWQRLTGYTGPVCLHIQVDSLNHPFCGNGAVYTRASVNAGEGYGLWVGCNEYHDLYACEQLGD